MILHVTNSKLQRGDTMILRISFKNDELVDKYVKLLASAIIDFDIITTHAIDIRHVLTIFYDITDVYTVFFKKCGHDGIEIPNCDIRTLQIKEGD